jgi:hypothetical protein
MINNCAWKSVKQKSRAENVCCNYRASKSLTATPVPPVHQAGGTSTSTLLGVGITWTAKLRKGPYSGVRAAHPLRIDLGEPPTTAGTSAAIHLAGSVCAGVNSFSTAGINAALPPRTGIGIHLPTAGLSTAKSMADSASAGDTVAVYDLAADNPDNPFAFNAICSALRGQPHAPILTSSSSQGEV